MTMRTPSARRPASAAGVVALIGSATAMMPAGWPSTATKIAVAPSRRDFVGLAPPDRRSATPRSCRASSALPIATLRPPIVPITPLPVTELKSVTCLRSSAAFLCGRNDRRRRADARSTAPDWRQATAPSLRQSPGAATTATTRGLPSVSVPVLSTTSVSTFSKRSRRFGIFDQNAAVAPLPTPTMIDIGVARPSAQGQAMMTTETAATSA